MPIIKSAKKALKRSQFLRNRNYKFKVNAKYSIKLLKKEVLKSEKDSLDNASIEKLNTMLKKAYQDIDKATRRNIFHKNNASRKKSKLAKMVLKITTK